MIWHLCNPTLYQWAWSGGETLARLVLLPAIWTNTVAKPNVSSKGGKVWVKVDDKWREGEIIDECKRMSKWIMQRGESNINTSRKAQSKRIILLLSTIIADAQKDELCLPSLALFLELDKI